MPAADPRAWGVHPQAVELVGRRTRHAKHWRLPDGRFQAVFGRQLHYEAAPGQWEEVDLTLRPAGADHVADRHDVHVRVSAAGVAAWDRATGRGIRWITPGRPAAAGRRARFADQGLDWEYITVKSGLKLQATVTAPLGPRLFVHPYALMGGAAPLAEHPDGHLVSDGFAVRRPVALGADGVRYPCGPLRLLPGQRVVWDWDDTGLPPEAFPYVLDPDVTFNIAVGTDDGMVYKSDAAYPPGGSASASSGTSSFDVERTLSAGTYTIAVGLVRWDTSSLGDTVRVTAATLRAKVSAKDDGDSRQLQAEWYEHNGIDAADYAEAAASDAHAGTAISAITSGASNDFALTNLTNVSRTGYTGLRLHISGGAPAARNRVSIYSYDHATEPEAQLLVTWETPGYHMII